MTEKEKTTTEQSLEEQSQQKDNFDGVEKQKEEREKERKAQEEVDQQKNKKEQSQDVMKKDTEQLLNDLDSEIARDVYTEKTRKEMLELRSDIASWKIDKDSATKKIDKFKENTEAAKDKSEQQSEDSESEEDLTIGQEIQKRALLTFVPFWIWAKLAKKIKPKDKSKNEEEKKERESKRWWKALKWTWILTIWTRLGKKIRDAVKDTIAENNEGKNEDEQVESDNKQEMPVEWEPSGIDTNSQQSSSEAPVAPDLEGIPEDIEEQQQLIQEKYDLLNQTYSSRGEKFLYAWATALALGQSSFEQWGITYYCYQNEDGIELITKDITEYEQIIDAQEQNLYDEDLPDVPEDLTAEQQQQSAEATQEANELRKWWLDELYILMRMYQRWFLPTKTFGFYPIDAFFNKQFDATVWLRKKLIPASRRRLLITQAKELTRMADPDYQKRFDMLAQMDADIKNGSITSIDDLHKKYGKQIETDISWKVRKSKKIQRVQKNIDASVDRYTINEKHIIELEAGMKKTKEASLKKLKEIDTQAKQTKDPKVRKKLFADLQKYTDEYNAKAIEYQKATWQVMSTMSEADIMRVENKSILVKGLLKSSWGATKFVEKASAKTGKIALWLAVFWLIAKWSWDIMDQWVISKETGLDVVDLGAWMVPFAWGVYDVTQAIRWKDLNGRELSTKDRLIRWWVWGVSFALDVLGAFTFGAGNAAAAALRAGAKWLQATTRVAKAVDRTVDVAKTADRVIDTAKAADKAVDASKTVKGATDLTNLWKRLLPAYKGVKVTSEVMMLWGIWYWLVEWVKDTVIPIGQMGVWAVKWIWREVDVVTTKPVAA